MQTPSITSLPVGSPLVDAEHGPTGLTLKRWLGAGGMATVFLAEHDGKTFITSLSPNTPKWTAVKLMHAGTARMLKKNGFDAKALVDRERLALTRVMQDVPPPDNVICFYGAGTFKFPNPSGDEVLPWLALEYVDGGLAGATLLDRARHAPQGLDPIRVCQIAEQVLKGAESLHRHRVFHRDIKPENVFVAGPTDDETIKLGDCGIARVEGATLPTIPAMSPQYAAPEQYLSQLEPTERNPLIGPWTDVHALAALVWFTITGEDWRTSSADLRWREGYRRPVETGEKVHPGFLRQRDLLRQIDEALRSGTAHGLPEHAWDSPTAQSFKSLAPALNFGATLWSEPRRFESVELFEIRLMPLLRSCADHWRELSAAANRAATAVRPTLLLPTNIELQGTSHRCDPVRGLDSILALEGSARIQPRNVAFQPDGRLLARFGRRLAFYVQDSALRVAVRDEHVERIALVRWIARLPGSGFGLASPNAILAIQDGTVRELALPTRENGKPIGEIQAVVGDASHFGIVTAEADYCGGPELWLWSQNEWKPPVVVPLAGDARFVATTPFGYLCVGAHPSGKGRAALLGFDHHAVSYVPVLTDAPPLNVGVGGTERESWVAGGGRIIRLDRAGAEIESSGFSGDAVDMGLDPIGSPWLVTTDMVLRRHLGQGRAKWQTYLSRVVGDAPFVAVGFTPRGADVIDADGRKHRLCPPDTRDWRAPHFV